MRNPTLNSALKTSMMEITLNKNDYSKTSKFEKNFSFRNHLRDPRFGEVSIIQNPNTREVLAVVETQINSKKDAGWLITNCKKRLLNKHPYILSLEDYSVKHQSELCSSFYLIKEFYEYPRSDLYREFMMKEKNGQYFSEEELTRILYQQLDANSYIN